jgi:hypothetical protein
MTKRPNHVLRNNAKRGAITTWCPFCHRKSALGRYLGGFIYANGVQQFVGGRTCRYCGFRWDGNGSEHHQLYKTWMNETKVES